MTLTMRRGGFLCAAFYSAAAISNEECAAKLKWFPQLTQQASDGVSKPDDELFKSGLSSISKGDASCGDTAAGQHEDCGKFKTWNTLEAVAEKQGKPFKVFDGPAKYSDVRQGALGDCYFLAALASIAHAQPEFIHDMFTHRDQWANDVYTTRWRLNGGDQDVVVNNKVPTLYHDSITAFAHGDDAAASFTAWPIILEKAWAKIFTNYKATEGGVWGTVLTSAVAANVESATHHQSDMETVWHLLEKGTWQKWPMGAGTGSHGNPTKYGLVAGHQYTVLQVTTVGGQRAVEVFNPWNKDGYHGQVPNEDKKDGKFTMTFQEYMDAFDVTEAAELRKGYHTVSKHIQGTDGVMMGQYEITVDNDLPFTVGVHWPSAHLIEPCTVPDPAVTLVVGKKTDWHAVTIGAEDGRRYGINVARAEVQSGAGTYVVSVSAKFKDTDAWIPNVHLTVYAADEVEIKESDMSESEAITKMLLPDCAGDHFTVTGKSSHYNGVYKKADQALNGVPYFVATDEATYLYFDGSRGKWTFINQGQWQDVLNGAHWTTPTFERAGLGKCGIYDSPDIGGFGGMTCMQAVDGLYGNVKCEGTKYSKKVQRYCPKACAQATDAAEDAATRAAAEKEALQKAAEGGCSEGTVIGYSGFKDGLYQKIDETHKDLPIYKSIDGKYIMYYKESCRAWGIIGSNQWAYVKQGYTFNIACFNKDDDSTFKCGRHDTSLIAPYSEPCSIVPAHKYSNVNCNDKMVEKYCALTCKVGGSKLFDTSMPALGARLSDASEVLSAKVFGFGAAVMLAVALVLARKRYTSMDRTLRGAAPILDPEASQLDE